MRRFNATVNGVSYDVVVEEVGAGASAPAAPTAPATSGARLINEDAIDVLKSELIPLATQIGRAHV